VKLATWNVNSIAARLPLVLRWVESARPDVLCLQEIKCVSERFPAADFEALGYTCEVFGQPTYNGVAVLTRTPIDESHRGLSEDDAARNARLLAVRTARTWIVDVYIPNGQAVGTDKYAYKLDWMAELRGFLDGRLSADDRVVLCGDFNVAPEARDVHDPKAWEGQVLFSEPERAALEEIRDWGFVDAFRLHEEGAGFYSWWDYRAAAFRRNAGLRIDHVWVSALMARSSTGAWIDKETRAWERPSDHAPVVVEFTD
jgi:exodeoxyribonuclease-3